MHAGGPAILSAMTQAAYRIIRTGSGFKVEINRPGETVHVAVGFESEADAKAWIEEDKRITGINDRQEPIDPPHEGLSRRTIMLRYQVYLLDRENRVAGFRAIDCQTDDDALAEAAEIVDHTVAPSSGSEIG